MGVGLKILNLEPFAQQRCKSPLSEVSLGGSFPGFMPLLLLLQCLRLVSGVFLGAPPAASGGGAQSQVSRPKRVPETLSTDFLDLPPTPLFTMFWGH